MRYLICNIVSKGIKVLITLIAVLVFIIGLLIVFYSLLSFK